MTINAICLVVVWTLVAARAAAADLDSNPYGNLRLYPSRPRPESQRHARGRRS